MLYSYRCRKCEHVFDRTLRMANRKEPEGEPCPKCENVGDVYQTLTTAPNLGDAHRMGNIKPPDGFNEVMRNIKKGNPGSTINIRD